MKLTVLLLSVLLLSSLINCHQKTKHHKSVKKDEPQDETQEEPQEEEFRRLKNKLIDDPRVTNPNPTEDKPFRTEYVKTKEDLSKYIQEKEESGVQKKYLQNTMGNDQFSESSLGNFYLIQDNSKLVGEYQVFLNDFALYYTSKKESGQSASYRHVKGSVTFKNLVDDGETKQILGGQCCKGISKVMFYKLPTDYKGTGLQEIKQEFRNLVSTVLKEEEFRFNSMTCLELTYSYGSAQQNLAICSQITNQLIQLKNQVTNQLIKMVMKQNGVTDYTVVMQTKADQQMLSLGAKYDKYKNWSYDKWQQWPRECKSQKMTNRFKSPVILPNAIFEANTKAQAKTGKDKQEEEVVTINWDEKDLLLVKEQISPFWLSDSDKESYSKQLKAYYHHPTYSYKGIHENYILGHLGLLSVTVKNVLDNQQYYGFALKFKLPGEHRFDQTNYNGEIQLHMTLVNRVDSKKAEMLNKLIGVKDKDNLAQLQFGRGYLETDALKAEYNIDQLTDLILAIPIQVKSDMTGMNLFLHYLNHEDWLEASAIQQEQEYFFDEKQSVKISNKDLEQPEVQDAKDAQEAQLNLEGEEMVNWQKICYPGSLKCLLEQFKQQRSLFFYQGTITTPPCSKPVSWVVMKNPLLVSKDDFNNLKKNVFQFREEDQARGNANRYLTYISDKDIKDGKLFRQIDSSEVKCPQTEQLKQFIRNSLIQSENQSSSSESYSQSDISENSSIIVQQSERKSKMFKEELLKDSQLESKLSSKVSETEWHSWFTENPQRYYRRLYSFHSVDNTLEELKKYASDALDNEYNFDYTIKTKESGVEEEDKDQNALVMVSGQLTQKQKLSSKSIKKVTSVITKAKAMQQTSSVSQKSLNTFVDIDIQTLKAQDKKRMRRMFRR